MNSKRALRLLILICCQGLAQSKQAQCNNADESNPRLGLPPGHTLSHKSSNSHQLVLGEGYSLYDSIGPLVINDDGSTRRISNWAVMSDREKNNTLRVLSRRNKVAQP